MKLTARQKWACRKAIKHIEDGQRDWLYGPTESQRRFWRSMNRAAAVLLKMTAK